MNDVRVAAAINVHGERSGSPLAEVAELLTSLHHLYEALSRNYDHVESMDDVDGLDVDPMMFNREDFADTARLEQFAGRLRSAGVLDAPEPIGEEGQSPAGDGEPYLLRIRKDRSLLVELTGDPPLLLVLWFCNRVDGEYKITEEYAAGGSGPDDVVKRVSFNTLASASDLVEALDVPGG